MVPDLIAFLSLIERELPPPPSCHHSITLSDKGLALQVNHDGKFHTFYIDNADIENAEHSLVYVKERIRY